MARLHLVRHAEPAAAYVEHPDPGLSGLGRRQAAALVDRLGDLRGTTLLSSPLQRATETGSPLAQSWGVALEVEPVVAEIHAPDEELAARAAWLRTALVKGWGELDHQQQAWRDALVTWCCGRREDLVVFTHFVAINVAIGAATGDDRVVCAPVGHASVTVVDVLPDGAGARLELVELGDEAPIAVT